MNKVILIGNLTRDVELKNTTTGKLVGKTSIATNKSYTDQSGQKQTVAQFHNLVVWGKRAEVFAKYVLKGHKVCVEGELSHRQYEQEGIKKNFTEIVVNDFHFLQNKQSNQSSGDYSQPSQSEDYSQPSFGDEEIQVNNIPF